MLSPPQHYAGEAEMLRQLIDQHFDDDQKKVTIIELGAGGGHTLCHLCHDYDCVAVDLSQAMLANCQSLNPSVETIVGDMRTISITRTFDVVLLNDAIDYMTCTADARAAIATAAAHLKDGGITFIAPTYTRESFIDGEVADDGATNRDDCAAGQLTYFSFVHDPDPTDETIEMILLYLIRDAKTHQVEMIEDRHACGLFACAQWQQWMADAGFKVEHRETEAWSLFIGRL